MRCCAETASSTRSTRRAPRVPPPHARRRPPPHAAPLAQILIRLDEQCKYLCRIEALSSAQAKAFRGRVEEDYRVNMCAAAWPGATGRPSAALAHGGPARRILDNLPVAMVKWRNEGGAEVKTYQRGFPVGFKSPVEVPGGLGVEGLGAEESVAGEW